MGFFGNGESKKIVECDDSMFRSGALFLTVKVKGPKISNTIVKINDVEVFLKSKVEKEWICDIDANSSANLLIRTTANQGLGPKSDLIAEYIFENNSKECLILPEIVSSTDESTDFKYQRVIGV